jgi:hypothetical protein
MLLIYSITISCSQRSYIQVSPIPPEEKVGGPFKIITKSGVEYFTDDITYKESKIMFRTHENKNKKNITMNGKMTIVELNYEEIESIEKIKELELKYYIGAVVFAVAFLIFMREVVNISFLSDSS